MLLEAAYPWIDLVWCVKEIGIMLRSEQVGKLNGLAFTVLPCCLNELNQSNTEFFRGCWSYMSSIQSLGTCLLPGKHWLHFASANIEFPRGRT